MQTQADIGAEKVTKNNSMFLLNVLASWRVRRNSQGGRPHAAMVRAHRNSVDWLRRTYQSCEDRIRLVSLPHFENIPVFPSEQG
jgi:hypothetical protein